MVLQREREREKIKFYFFRGAIGGAIL